LNSYPDVTDTTLAKALAHPLRTRILAALEGRTASPNELATELATELDASLGVISYHVRRLHALGFVKLVKRVPRRGAVAHYYTATTRPRITDATWGATPTIVKHATIKSALDQIASYVNAAAVGGGFDAQHPHLTQCPLSVDEQGFTALARELEAVTARIQKIEADSKKRLTRNDHESEQQATVVMMLFNSPSATTPAVAPKPAPKRTIAARRPNGRQPADL
jgi:DNA-binding transcriptional ArsR family regulator